MGRTPAGQGGSRQPAPQVRALEPAALGCRCGASSAPQQLDPGQATCPLWDTDSSSVEWISQPCRGSQRD